MSLSSTSIELLKDQRSTTQRFFDDQKISAQQIIEISTQTLPARVISFDYYNDSSLGERIASLNDDINVSYFSKEIEIFTS